MEEEPSGLVEEPEPSGLSVSVLPSPYVVVVEPSGFSTTCGLAVSIVSVVSGGGGASLVSDIGGVLLSVVVVEVFVSVD